MSAYMVEKHHIGYLVAAAFDRAYRIDAHLQPSLTMHEMAELLSLENARSIVYRYPQDSMDDTMHTWAKGEVESMLWMAIKPEQVIQSVRCYQYQACEHPGWNESRAKDITDRLLMAAVRVLPAVEKAEWGAPEPMSRNVKRLA